MSRGIPRTSDVIVVGAGTAGCAAARAAARRGLGVLLVDSRPGDEIGDKVCGGALTREGIAALGAFCDPPAGVEITQELDGGTILLADGRTEIEIDAPGVVLNRGLFGRRLLADAVAAGAEFRERCTCSGWDDRAGTAVRVRNAEDVESVVAAGVVIDCTGYRGTLARSGGPSHRDPLGRSDAGIGYREIVPLMEPLQNPRLGLVALSPEGTHGGYAWIFPMGPRLANVGIGSSVVTAGGDLRSALRAFLEARRGIAAASPVAAGAGMLPLRRPLASPVGDGFLAAGDAACHANPLHGGGIAPSIIAGAMAGEEAARAIRGGDTSTGGLWPYAVSFMRGVGATHAAHEILRRMIYGLRDDDFDLLCVELGRSGMMLGTIGGRGPRVPLAAALSVARKAAGRPRLLRRLLEASRLSRSMFETYRAYPESPDRLGSWVGRVEYHLRAVDRLVGGAR